MPSGTQAPPMFSVSGVSCWGVLSGGALAKFYHFVCLWGCQGRQSARRIVAQCGRARCVDQRTTWWRSPGRLGWWSAGGQFQVCGRHLEGPLAERQAARSRQASWAEHRSRCSAHTQAIVSVILPTSTTPSMPCLISARPPLAHRHQSGATHFAIGRNSGEGGGVQFGVAPHTSNAHMLYISQAVSLSGSRRRGAEYCSSPGLGASVCSGRVSVWSAKAGFPLHRAGVALAIHSCFGFIGAGALDCCFVRAAVILREPLVAT